MAPAEFVAAAARTQVVRLHTAPVDLASRWNARKVFGEVIVTNGRSGI